MLNGTLASPNCGALLSMNLTITHVEKLNAKSINYTLMMTAVAFLQASPDAPSLLLLNSMAASQVAPKFAVGVLLKFYCKKSHFVSLHWRESLSCTFRTVISTTLLKHADWCPWGSTVHVSEDVSDSAAEHVQVLLLMRQMDGSDAPAAAAKVSLLMLGQQAILDALLCLAHLTAGVAISYLLSSEAYMLSGCSTHLCQQHIFTCSAGGATSLPPIQMPILCASGFVNMVGNKFGIASGVVST